MRPSHFSMPGGSIPVQSGILSRNRVAIHTEHATTASGIRLAGLRAGGFTGVGDAGARRSERRSEVTGTGDDEPRRAFVIRAGQYITITDLQENLSLYIIAE